jgi:hypothetical protein
VLVRWRGLGHPEAAEGLKVLQGWVKVCCKLREVATDAHFDSRCQLRLRNSFDVTPSLLVRPYIGKRSDFIGLVTAFNERYGTNVEKDVDGARCNWEQSNFSQAQLDYAALGAWMSYRLGAEDDGTIFKRRRRSISVSEMSTSYLLLPGECCENVMPSRTPLKLKLLQHSPNKHGKTMSLNLGFNSSWRNTKTRFTRGINLK